MEDCGRQHSHHSLAHPSIVFYNAKKHIHNFIRNNTYQTMIYLLISSLLLVIGIGLLGGALFGRIRPRRLTLLTLALAAWTLAGCAAFGSKQNADVPTLEPATPTIVAPTHSPAPSPTPTAEVAPTETSAPTVAPAAAPGESPLSTPTAIPKAGPASGKLVFPSGRSGNLDLWVMDLAAPDAPTQLTTSPAADVEPRWSPDGKMVLFSSPGDGQYNDLFIINADGSGRKRLLDWPGSHEWGAAWSPDGQQIAFTSEKDGNYQIYVMPFDGDSEPINLMQDKFFYTYPDWSPDGKWLVFVSDRSGYWDIWKLDVTACLDARLAGQEGEIDACQPRQLTENPDDDFFPRWSPDGAKIAFSSRRQADRDIYVMDADGGNVTRLTTTPGNDSNPIWALDGQAIIFSRRPQTDWDLYIINADGSDMQQLTDSPGQDRFGDWKP